MTDGGIDRLPGAGFAQDQRVAIRMDQGLDQAPPRPPENTKKLPKNAEIRRKTSKNCQKTSENRCIAGYRRPQTPRYGPGSLRNHRTDRATFVSAEAGYRRTYKQLYRRLPQSVKGNALRTGLP